MTIHVCFRLQRTLHMPFFRLHMPDVLLARNTQSSMNKHSLQRQHATQTQDHAQVHIAGPHTCVAASECSLVVAASLRNEVHCVKYRRPHRLWLAAKHVFRCSEERCLMMLVHNVFQIVRMGQMTDRYRRSHTWNSGGVSTR